MITSTMASQITSLAIVYSTVYSGADQRKHQSSASLALVRGIHRRPVNSPHKWPVTRKMFPFDDVIMTLKCFDWHDMKHRRREQMQSFSRNTMIHFVYVCNFDYVQHINSCNYFVTMYALICVCIEKYVYICYEYHVFTPSNSENHNVA